ncbi:MAG: hypothetical protein ACK4FF_01855 [Limnobacter sp.]|uniref:hypothetical protein n=1 Tax=Limnobacter sp. TaxID=2003368 RepID=UPI00391ABB3F
MSIRAPYCTLHRPAPRAMSLEREVFYETLGACWALSARNVSGYFGLQLQIDLTRVNLLYGVPAVDLDEHLLMDFLRTFQARKAARGDRPHERILQQAQNMVHGMDTQDVLNFSTAFEDAVGQVLDEDPDWSTECSRARLALKYQALQLLDRELASPRAKKRYAQLLANYLRITQATFRASYARSELAG